jgi:hypothetical protein
MPEVRILTGPKETPRKHELQGGRACARQKHRKSHAEPASAERPKQHPTKHAKELHRTIRLPFKFYKAR